MDLDAAELPFRPVEGTAPTAGVVEQLRSGILNGRLANGDRLPPERVLAEIFAVSRGTLRDALRTLQANGLITVRVGAKGGTFVTAPKPVQVAERITQMLALSELTAADVTEARVLLELGMLPLVIERATTEDLDDLERICDEADAALAGGTHTFQYSLDFHHRLAQASHSSATALIIDALHEPLLGSMLAASSVAPQMAPQGSIEHRELVHAVRDRDLARARGVLSIHLLRTLERVGGNPELAKR